MPLLLAASMPLAAQSSDTQARQTFDKVCTTCHKAETVTANRRTREQWQESITSMIARGAKGTDAEFASILNYLSANYGVNSPAAAGPATAAGRGGRAGRGGGGGGAGADDKHVVDLAAAERGRKVYAAECINCHGTHARGTERGADLVRSLVVLHDRYGNEIGPFLRKGHPTQSTPSAKLSSQQIQDLSHLLHQEVYNTLRSALEIQNILTGDPKAGAAYFNGAGKCTGCHSVTGDLKGVGTRLSPPMLQQRFLFPMAGGFGGGRGRGNAPSRTTLTVTPPNGPAVSGSLVHLDDFDVSLRDSNGEYHSWKRTPALKIVKHDPYQAHIELLDKISDKNMHDVVAYLEGLK